MNDRSNAGDMVDQARPWLGLASFSEATRGYFHGRDEEVGELSRRVQRKLLTVLFGQSGLGKTSILRAGIVPRLREQGYCPVYLRIDYGPDAPAPAQQVLLAIEAAAPSANVAVQGESLWEFLHQRDLVLRDADGKAVIPLLIFDQFEEIFTLAQGDAGGRARAAAFIEDLAELAENRIPAALEARLETEDDLYERFDFARADYRVLIALREDYLAHLETLKASMPSITQNRMRLAPMNGQQALAAVREPGAALVDDEVAAAIVRFVAGGAELANAQVEPSLLSLICRELNEARIASGRSEISLDLVAGSHASILSDFYERALAGHPAAVRNVVEDVLLTASGYRENVAEERIVQALAAAGAAPDALADLVNRRLLRIEDRLDVRRVELTHDVLCPVVRASGDLRKERELREAGELALAERNTEESAARRSLGRVRLAAGACIVLAIGAIGASGFAYLSTERARKAEFEARQVQAASDQARSQAEQLTAYLLDDFARELEGVSSQQMFVDLGKQVHQYYDALPAIAPNSQTELYRTLAQVTYANALIAQNQLAEAAPVIARAVAVFERRKRDTARPDQQSDVGMALALLARVELDMGKGEFDSARAAAGKAFDLLAPWGAQKAAGAPVRRVQARTLVTLAGLDNALNEGAKAVEKSEKARLIYQGLGALELKDLSDTLGYAEASATLAGGLQRSRKYEESTPYAEQAYALADKILLLRPDHLLALKNRAAASGSLASVKIQAGRHAAALEDHRHAYADLGRALRLDPRATLVRVGQLYSQLDIARRLYFVGRLREAMAEYASIAKVCIEHDVGNANMGDACFKNADFMAELARELGDHAGAQAQLEAAQRIVETSFSGKKEVTTVLYFGSELAAMRAEFAVEDGKYAEASSAIAAEIVRIGRLGGDKAWADIAVRRMLLIDANGRYGARDFTGAERILAEHSPVKPYDPARPSATSANARQYVLRARVLVGLRKPAEARAVLQPVLDLYRARQAARHDSALLGYDLANTLEALASGLQGAARQAALAEARSLVARLPKEVAAMVRVTVLRKRLADAESRPRA